MDPMILASMFYVQRNENGSLGRKRRYLRASSVKTAIKKYWYKVCQQVTVILIPLF